MVAKPSQPITTRDMSQAPWHRHHKFPRMVCCCTHHVFQFNDRTSCWLWETAIATTCSSKGTEEDDDDDIFSDVVIASNASSK